MFLEAGPFYWCKQYLPLCCVKIGLTKRVSKFMPKKFMKLTFCYNVLKLFSSPLMGGESKVKCLRQANFRLGTTTLNIITFSITTFSIMTLSITINKMQHSA